MRGAVAACVGVEMALVEPQSGTVLTRSQGEGMLKCGTDSKVGDPVFLKTFENKPAVALDAVKKGAAAIFAVRTKPVKKSVDAGSSSADA